MYGNISELADVSRRPGKSYLFFLTASFFALESVYPEIGLHGWESTSCLRCPVPCGRPLKMRGRELFAPLVVLITASGLQGEQPLVDRIT